MSVSMSCPDWTALVALRERAADAAPRIPPSQRAGRRRWPISTPAPAAGARRWRPTPCWSSGGCR